MENKIQFKKIMVVALVLMLFSGFSGVLIVGLNLFTEPIIERNNQELEARSLKELYDAEFEEVSGALEDTSITKIYAAIENDNIVGYVYNVSGKNAYGSVTLLVGIDLNGKTKNVVIMENTESYAAEVNEHINQNYQSSSVDASSIDDVDVKCGATKGAILVKELITDALTHFNNNLKDGGEN